MDSWSIYVYPLVITFLLRLSGIYATELGVFPWHVRETLSEKFRYGGVAAAKALIVKSLDEWSKEGDINIAVTGNSGVGKSSFINALRGKSSEDQDAAEVGETTLTVKDYRYPRHDRLVLWDLPGIGSPLFRQEEYLDRINASRFDAFVIISSGRFTENDLWLANQFERLGKGFYFVRSKISQDIENDKKSHPATHSTAALLNNIRNNCEINLKHKVNNSIVYLIDNYDTDKYDFKQLSDTLEKEASFQKKKSLRHALLLLTDEMISAKKKELIDRIHGFAVASLVAGALPIPGIDIVVDLVSLLEEIGHYRSSFGLQDDSLQEYGESLEIPLQQLKNSTHMGNIGIQYIGSGLITYLLKSGVVYVTLYFLSKTLKLPIIGSVISATASFATTEICLNRLLDLTTDDALRLNRYDYN